MKEPVINNLMSNFISDSSFLAVNVDESLVPFTVNISNTSKNLCVGLVDMVNSTKITAKLPQKKTAKYYEIFLNSIANVLNNFGGVVIKNIGDSLLFCFPEASKLKRKYGFMNCLECFFMMIKVHDQIKEKLEREGLPPVDYRISADYGFVSIMKSTTTLFDIIGTPVNLCAKINRQAPVNGIIIGGDLHQVVQNFDEYYFKEADGFSVGLKQAYPFYSVRRRHTSHRNDNIDHNLRRQEQQSS